MAEEKIKNFQEIDIENNCYRKTFSEVSDSLTRASLSACN